MNKKLSKSTLDLGKNDDSESSTGRRELNKKIKRLEQAEKQNSNIISQLRTINDAMRMELRLLRPKNALTKGCFPNTKTLCYAKTFSINE